VAVAAGIATVEIVGDDPNSTAVEVNAADPQVGYTLCDILEGYC
jgi:hypothetical protein